MTDNTQVGLKELCEAFIDGDISAGQFKRAVRIWHNKQTLELLDKLESNMRGKTVIDTAEGWKEFIRKHVNGAIEAERNKLNNSDGDVK